ncbi:MAG: asparagine synthase (glutamine-hydrolyzing) [Rhizomicrobium sp.]
MCGINGIYAYHRAASAPNARELLATREHMLARGPDGCGQWWSRERRCGLAHRRLSILDLSDRALQPMVAGEAGHVVVFNGEIYNYPELRATLEADGVRFETSSDTEVLLQLYARHGRAMLEHLRGMYAFAIWDERRRGLFLARDPYGIKPLYTADDGWSFRFASQVKALVAGQAVSSEPEPAAIVGFYLFGHVPEPFTLYRQIRALPAGHWQWVDEAGPGEPQPFARLSEVLAHGALSPQAPEVLPTALRMAARESVGAHLLADVEVGLFLSSGIDSGALLGLMRDAGQDRIRAVTLEFGEFAGSAEDEAPLAREVARHYGAQHIVRRVGAEEFREDLPRIFAAMDQPSIDGINTWFVAKAAREAGLKVALSGLGGDELLAGYPSFSDLPHWRRRFGAVAQIPFLGCALRVLGSKVFPARARSQPKALAMLEYASSLPGAYLLRRGLFMPHELPALVGEEMTRAGLRRLRPLQRLAGQLDPDPLTMTGRICVLESSNYMRNQLLRDADWAGMAHSLEIRVPLVDWQLVRALAPHMAHLTAQSGKQALARAPMTGLPEAARLRPKSGFGVPTAAWMMAGDGVSAMTNKGLVSRQWSRHVLRQAL